MASGEFCGECGAALPAGWPRGLCSPCALKGALGLSDSAVSEPLAESEAFAKTSAFPRPFGDYELLEEIAQGGMGIVYKARQKSLDRIVAIKMLLFGPMADQGLIRRFRGEAVAAGGLRHRNIVAVHEVGIHDGQHFLVMDYVDGLNLAAFAAAHPLTPRRAAVLVKQVAEAIEYAHGCGLLHRDLKPSNILMDAAGAPHVTDFGLARRIEGDSSLTMTGQALGSPGYMPPEQAAAGRGKICARSDVYGLGATLYHLLTGHPPFQGFSIPETLERVLNAEPVPPRLIDSRTPPDLETICLKCLQKEPEKRYASARELADELGRFLEGAPIEARPIGAAEKAWRFCRRKPALSAFAAAAVSLLLVVAIGSPISVWRIRTSERTLAENLYAADMQLAQVSLAEGNWGRARSLLEAHAPKPGAQDLRGFEWAYYKNLARGEQARKIEAHTSILTAIAFAPGGQMFASAGMDGRVRFWSFPEMRPEGEIYATNVKFVSLSFRSDGKLLAATTDRGAGYLWQVNTRQLLTNFPAQCNRAVFEPDGNLLAIIGGRTWGDDTGPLRLWDSERKSLLQSWEEAGSRVAWARDGKRIFVGPLQESVGALDIGSEKAALFPRTGRTVHSMAVSPDGKRLAAATVDIKDRKRSIWLWDVASGKELGELRGHTANIWQLSFSPDSRLLASASSDQSIRIWDIATCSERSILRGHGSEVWSVAFSADGRNLVSGDKEGALMVWDLPPPPRDDLNTNLYQIVGPRAFSPNGRWMAVGAGSNQVVLVDLEAKQIQRVFDNAMCAIGFEDKGQMLVTLDTDSVTRHPLFTNLPPVSRAIEPRLATDFLAVSQDHRLLAAENEPGQLYLWNLAQRKLLRKVALPEGERVTALAFSPDSSHLAVMREETAEMLLFSDDLKNARTLVGHSLAVWGAAFNSKGNLLVTGAMDDKVIFWNPKTGERLATLEGHKEGISGVAISPDDKTVAVVCGNNTIKLWNIPTRREVGNLAFSRTLMFVDFSPDGRYLVGHNPWNPDTRFDFWEAPPAAAK